ncbi:thioredoxin-dependent thiol peroxidase [bacterium]|nr:thioredoxin-dependent thiol peroxidase [bacterium]
MLKEGTKAPDFEVQNQKGETVRLSDYNGKKVVLYFYPKDNTPTCTVEACNLRDNFKALQDAGYTVLGVSPDSVKKHQNFIEKYDLPFDLLADTEKEIVSKYEVWAEKQMYGRKYMGVLRTTYLINEQGVIEKVISKVKSKEHASQILD